MAYILTHTRPDWDAIASVWLLRRFGGCAGIPVRFVGANTPLDSEIYANAMAVCDIGRVHDVEAGRFDHHQWPDNDTSATELVHAVTGPSYIAPLIDLITAADLGQRTPEVLASRELGIHSLLSGWTAQGLSDEELIARGFEILDNLAKGLELKGQAAQEFAVCYRGSFQMLGQQVAMLEGAGVMANENARERGYSAVLFIGKPQATTYPRGLMRLDGKAHMGEAVRRALSRDLAPNIRAELEQWFCHEAGFYAGLGSAKAPHATPCRVSMYMLAMALHDQGYLN